MPSCTARSPRHRLRVLVSRPLPQRAAPRFCGIDTRCSATTTRATCWPAPGSARPKPRSAMYAPLTRGEAVAKLLRETRTTAVTPAARVGCRHVAAARRRAARCCPKRIARLSSSSKCAKVSSFARGGCRKCWPRLAAHRADDAVLAQPLRVGAAESADRAPHVSAERHACASTPLGNFGVLLHAIAKDPAMIIYLDSVQNRKGAPNENFAREVMELFTLGEGHYTEQDVKEAARAFTGWSLERETGDVRLPPAGCTTTGRRSCSPRPDASTAMPCSTSCSRAPRPPNSSRPSCGASSCRRIPDPDGDRTDRPPLSRIELRHQGRAARIADRATRSTRRQVAPCW